MVITVPPFPGYAKPAGVDKIQIKWLKPKKKLRIDWVHPKKSKRKRAKRRKRK